MSEDLFHVQNFIHEIRVLLGHSNISTTLNLYVHPNLEQKRKCIETMGKMLK